MAESNTGVFAVTETADGVMVGAFDVTHHKKRTDGRRLSLCATARARMSSRLGKLVAVVCLSCVVFVVVHTTEPGGGLEQPNMDFMIPHVIYESADDNLPVQSVSMQNVVNLQGQYLHHPHQSPYASTLYTSNQNDKSLIPKIQSGFEERKNKYLEVFGEWKPTEQQKQLMGDNDEEEGGSFNTADATNTTLKAVRYMDWKLSDIPLDAWQRDKDYLTRFIQSSKDLVDRMKLAIYEEYGFGTKMFQSDDSLEHIVNRRRDEFKVVIEDGLKVQQGQLVDKAEARIPASAFLNKSAWEGLVRKLLHAMMTNGEFYVVVAGNANAYAGNNLFQTQIMQFNHVMEPVLEKLGVRLISRNMAMNATTAITALGGSDLFGEADILWYIPDSESKGEADLLHRLSILSGERVPIVLTPYPESLWTQTNHAAWMGNIQPGATFCDRTVRVGDKTMVPRVKACRYVNCQADPMYCENKNSVCWVNRTDVKLKQAQDEDVGHQNEGFDGYLKHRAEGYKLAFLVLKGLDSALNRWKDYTHKGQVPLPEAVWHVGPIYDTVRDKVRPLQNLECEKFLRKADPRICRMEMHAASEWTPRVHPEGNSLRNLLAGSSVSDNQDGVQQIYDTADLLPVPWRTTHDEMDVHLVALLSSPNSNRRKLDHTVQPVSKQGKHFGRRQLELSGISKHGWTLFNAPRGFCDGSAQSQCNRVPTNTCLLSNYNYYRSGLIANGYSGPLKLRIPRVRHGLIMARFDWELIGEDGELGPRVRNLPYDYFMDITVDGIRVSRHDRTAFAKHAIDLTGGLRLHMILNKKDFEGPRDVHVEIEVVSKTDGLKPQVYLSHIYWA